MGCRIVNLKQDLDLRIKRLHAQRTKVSSRAKPKSINPGDEGGFLGQQVRATAILVGNAAGQLGPADTGRLEFQNDGNAYLKYAMAEQMNKDLKVRMFHAGPGTFWTNLGDKNMSLMMPVPSGDKAAPEVQPAKDKDKNP